jgi:hypothetical protein
VSLQLIVRGASAADIEATLAPSCGDAAEVFAIDMENVGISIPTALLDSVGEEKIRTALRYARVYDLYAGVWHDAT